MKKLALILYVAIFCVYYVKGQSDTPTTNTTADSGDSGPTRKNVRISNLNFTVRRVVRRGNAASSTTSRNRNGSLGASIRNKMNNNKRNRNNVARGNKKKIAFKNGKTSIRKLN